MLRFLTQSQQGATSMADLTDEQLSFLRQHNISPMAVFDASGMTRSEYYNAMKEEEKFFAIGVTPCKKFGHTIRERNGHCIQCKPSNIEFILRKYRNGWIYVFASPGLKMVKIGSSLDPKDRERTVNGYKYGGRSDWFTIAKQRSNNSGKIEFGVHQKLSDYYHPLSYHINNKETICREIFSCSYLTARDALIRSLVENKEKPDLWETDDAEIRFSFPNVKNEPQVR
jgi:T5orf172 domain